MSSQSADGALVVLESVPRPRPTTNPYLTQLLASLETVPDVSVQTFSWRTALRGDYDVFHVHWPENLLTGQSPAKSLVRRIFTRALLVRLRRKRIPIVRTMHNLAQPAGLRRADYRILDRIEAQTALVIRLNEQTPVADGVAFETIAHGHYRDWFAPFTHSSSIEGRLGFIGLIRRYKNVAHLVSVVTALPASFSLRVSGNPSSAEVAREIQDAAHDDPRIALDFHFLSDAELVTAITEAELVVLPYTEMHNSGSVLASLSLDRPVLVRDNAVNRQLSTEVGEGWIFFYDNGLKPEDVVRTHAALVSDGRSAAPDLRRREWAEIGVQHVEAFRRALGFVRR